MTLTNNRTTQVSIAKSASAAGAVAGAVHLIGELKGRLRATAPL